MSARPESDGPLTARAEQSAGDQLARSWQDSTGRPNAVASIEFVRSLHFALLETFGDDTQDVLYRIGYEWGLRDMTALRRRLRDEPGAASTPGPAEAQAAFDQWWQPLLAGGWGSSSLSPTSKTRGIATIDLRNSLVADALPGADYPVCHLYAGLFAGALSLIERAERHGVEISCRAVGDTACIFVIAPAAEIDAIETWRQQGIVAGEIVSRLR